LNPIAARLGLRGKFVVALVALTLLGMLMLGVVGVYTLQSIRAELGSAYARDVTLLKQARIVAPIERDVALSLRMADSEPIRAWLLDEQNADKKRIALTEAKGYQAQFQSRSVFVISGLSDNYYFNNPAEAYSESPRYTLDRSKPEDSWFVPTLNMAGSYNTNVSVDVTLKVTNVWINALMRADGKPLGLVGTGVALNQFLDEFVSDAEPGVTPIIVDRNGAILAHPDPALISDQAATQAVDPAKTLSALLSDAPSLAAANAALAAAHAHPGEARPVPVRMRGTDVLLAASYVPDLQWYVISAVDLGHAHMLGTRQLLGLGLATLLLLVLVSAASALVVDRMVVRPVLALQRSAVAMSEGQYAPAADATVAGNDEIGVLTRSFGQMAQEVQRHTEHLESTVRARTAELQRTNEAIVAVNAKLADSISYASRIQATILPTRALERCFGDQHHVLWLPRDVVGGDFYLLHEDADGVLLGVMDCAGHGVPGALMTMLARAALDTAISQCRLSDPAAILSATDQAMRASMHVGDRDRGAATSMDAGLVYIDQKHQRLLFAGAKIDLLWADPQGQGKLNGGKRALADRRVGQYQNVELAAPVGRRYVLCSDGLLDQNGGTDGYAFGEERLIELLAASLGRPLARFGTELSKALTDYRGALEQRDDITVLAFGLPSGLPGAR